MAFRNKPFEERRALSSKVRLSSPGKVPIIVELYTAQPGNTLTKLRSFSLGSLHLASRIFAGFRRRLLRDPRALSCLRKRLLLFDRSRLQRFRRALQLCHARLELARLRARFLALRRNEAFEL